MRSAAAWQTKNTTAKQNKTKQQTIMSGTDMYHRTKFHADWCHDRRLSLTEQMYTVNKKTGLFI